MAYAGVAARCALALLCLVGAEGARAWGPRGHMIVAEIAARELTPAARSEVEALLGDRAAPALRAAESWADEVRTWPGYGDTAALHYVNFPRNSCQYDARRDCVDGRCVVDATTRFARVLRDSRDPAARRDALKWVLHLVADVHQPLHAGHRDDRGGNHVQLRHRGEGTNLHALLDSGVLRLRGLRSIDYAEALLREQPRPPAGTLAWSDAAAARWAEESCVEVAGVYPARRRVDAAFEQRMTALLERRLFLAGLRLGALLNAELGAASARDNPG